MKKKTDKKNNTIKINQKIIIVSIFANTEQEKLFSKIAQKSMLNNAKNR